MLDYRELNKENISLIKDINLLDIFFDSIMEMMEIDFVEMPEHELGRDIITPDYDDIRSKIRYEYEEINGRKRYSMKVPVIDETKRERYQKKVFATNKIDIIPEKGFFVKMYANLTIKPLGLVEVYFWGGKLQRMDKDYKNLPPIKEFDRIEYLFYDYENKEYKQLDTEEMERVKLGLKRGKELDELLNAEDKTSELIRIYLEREEILDLGLKKLNGLAEDLQEMYITEFKDDAYDVRWESNSDPGNYSDYSMKRDSVGKPNHISLSDITTEDIEFYLMRYAKNLFGPIRQWLKIKIVFSTITKQEYKKLIEHITEFSALVLEIKERLSALTNSIKGTEIEIDWEKPQRLNIDQEENVKWVIKFLDKLTTTNIPRPVIFNKQLPLQGYIGVDVEKGEVYPNLAELENRRYLKEEFSSIFEDEKYKEQVLKSQSKK